MERRSRNWVRVGRVGSEGVRQDRVEGQSRQRGRVGSEVTKADRAGGAKGQCGQRAKPNQRGQPRKRQPRTERTTGNRPGRGGALKGGVAMNSLQLGADGVGCGRHTRAAPTSGWTHEEKTLERCAKHWKTLPSDFGENTGTRSLCVCLSGDGGSRSLS